MQMLNPYLHFNGQYEEAFNFYAEVLGGEIVAMMIYKGTPAEEQPPAEWRNKIIHARLMWVTRC
jgi:PhnB protein